MSERNDYSALTAVFFVFAVFLRLALFWVNPPHNTFDDHFEPIFHILEEGAVPSKDACWECFQPPLFYLISASVGRVAVFLTGSSPEDQLKLLQFLPCLYGILTVYFTYLILKRVDISEFARMLAFGMVCFLPRHIYMSAMHTNDTLSYLLVSVCAYLVVVLIDRAFADSPLSAPMSSAGRSEQRRSSSRMTLLLVVLLMGAMLLALFTKSTALVVLPMVGVLLVLVFVWPRAVMGKRTAVYWALLLVIPAAVVGANALSDARNYGEPLPLNIELLDVTLTQPPGREGLSLVDFRPWTAMRRPLLAPDNVGSFWTLVTSRMWFDMEPKFLQYTDPDALWWDAYDDYLNRHDRYDWPGEIMLSRFTRFSGAALIALGLVPLAFIVLGIGRGLLGKWSLWSKNTDPADVLKVQVFVVLLLFNLGGILFHVYRYPYYSFMKAAFILNSVAAFALFLALGIMLVEKFKAFKWGLSIAFTLIFTLSTVHILHIILSIGPGASQLAG